MSTIYYYMKIINITCNYCGKIIEKPLKEYNRRIKKGKHFFYCNNSCGAKKINEKFKSITIKKTCPHCKSIFESTTSKKSKTFCSRYCAAKHSTGIMQQTEEYKKESRERSINLWKNEEYINKSFVNIGKRRYTSKGEEEIKKHFKETYKDDGWTFGPCFNGDRMLVRDLFSKKLKVCIEYDGIWHFEDIHGQLKDKQEKDFLLEDWCIKNNFRLIRIKEDIYNQDKKYWIKKLEEEVYNGIEKLVKFY